MERRHYLNFIKCNLVELSEESGFLSTGFIYMNNKTTCCPIHIFHQKETRDSTIVFPFLQRLRTGLITLQTGRSTQGYFNQNFNSICKALRGNHHSLRTDSPQPPKNWEFLKASRLASVFGRKLGWVRQTRNPRHAAGAHASAPRR